MKFTHLGFSQRVAIDIGLDDKDLAILRWFIDFKDSNKITKKVFDGEIFYWVKYEAVIEEYPIFKFKKDTVYRRLKAMADKGILKHRTLKQGGVWSFYTVGDRYIELISDEPKEDESFKKESKNNEGISEPKEVGFKSEQFGNKSEVNGFESESNGLKSGTKNPSTISIYHNIYSAKDAQDIWNLYPNKKGKAQAMKKIPKLLENLGKDVLVGCIKKYADEVRGKDKQYILNGSTFFNGRYEDYLDDVIGVKEEGKDNSYDKKVNQNKYIFDLSEDM